MGHAPIEVFTMLKPSTNFNAFAASQFPEIDVQQIQRSKYVKLIQQLAQSMQEMHQKVMHHKAKRREAAHKRREQTSIAPDFQVGDYVCKARDVQRTGDKLLATFSGMYTITQKMNNHIYRIKDIITNEEQNAHAARLKFFQGSDYEVTEELKCTNSFFHRCKLA